MTLRGDEQGLVAVASAAHPSESVVAAGVFSWQKLLGAAMEGATLGGMAGDLVGDDIGSVVGAVAGQHLAVEAKAESNGMTVALLVAVTSDHIYVHNLEGDTAGNLVADFPREATIVTIKKMGLSRIVHLENETNGDNIALHGSVSPISAQSKPDKVVMALLASHPHDA